MPSDLNSLTMANGSSNDFKKFRLNLNYNIIFSCHIVDDRCYTINKVTVYYVVYKLSLSKNLLSISNVIGIRIKYVNFLTLDNATNVIATVTFYHFLNLYSFIYCFAFTKKLLKSTF